ncbi:MAG: sulfoxide reductase heme-binding subunit YedZ [Anaerolineae bacterium]|nr:sulfoxide reductase heme-binding subunit YedZ [Anaerolineae bacterium]
MSRKWFVDFQISNFSLLQWFVHAGVWLSVIWLIIDAATGNLTANPVQAATQRAGKSALILLVLSLACTPLSSILGWKQFSRVRRALGLYAFLYAAGHFILFSGVDYGFNLKFIWNDAANKPYIWVGLVALSILLVLAVTSFRWWMRRLGKAWKSLHRLVYLAAPLVILHYAWARKGNLFTLSGDMVQPLLFGILLILLLVGRIPSVSKAAAGWVSRLRAALPSSP